MTYEKALEAIHSLKRFGSVLGLSRIETLLSLLGNPQEKLKFIHVAGTNGKGSTCAMTAAVLTRAGYKTGLYISPFVEDFRERIQIDRNLIPKDALAAGVEKLLPLAQKTEALTGAPVTEFEFETALAMDYYAREGCDFVVLEVGLGGRFDATNVITSPLLSVIGYIGLDHTGILGETIEEIAFEKCGIIKPGCPVVSYAAQRPGAARVIAEEAEKRGSRLITPDITALDIQALGPEGSDFTYRGKAYHLGIPGEHIVKNALSVIEGITHLAESYPALLDALPGALAAAQFGGRFEKIGPDFYIDAAHNPDCVDAVTAMLNTFFADKKKIIIMGILGDKDHAYCVTQVARLADHFFAVTPDSPRAQAAEITAAEAKPFCPAAIPCATIKEAVDAALSAKDDQSIILALGSLYYIGAVKEEYQNR
ncbi:MAG: bifunctional folylpolyglutamate synthase/dihydrofolate synthase [Clostridia bacterium]|nr:bifunctional folylpolyglutamate synthase/dihydrofolate synthase [Clostridia bacterium]